jgi:hypothetical protein
MSSLFGSSASSSSSDMQARKEQMKQQITQELAIANAQQLINVSDCKKSEAERSELWSPEQTFERTGRHESAIESLYNSWLEWKLRIRPIANESEFLRF